MIRRIICLLLVSIVLLITACKKENSIVSDMSEENSEINNNSTEYVVTEVTADKSIKKLKNGLSVVRFDGDDLFESFLDKGGASKDADVVAFLTQNLKSLAGVSFGEEFFGCSTIALKGNEGCLYGRNFDWKKCDAIIVESHPTDSYSSISTVNMDFIKSGAGPLTAFLSDEQLSLVAIYAPLDGMNEKGLFVSVNMIQDSATINQNTSKSDITTTTAVRMLLNKAATVEEAVSLLEGYDMHASFGMMVHFALADSTGNSVVVEYVDNELVVTKTPVVTNFYIAEGEKHGVGTKQSHDRYEKLMQFIDSTKKCGVHEVAGALNSVSKHNYNVPETTEWSIVFNPNLKEAFYFHREDFTKAFHMKLQ